MSRKLALVQWSKTLAVLLIIAGLQILLLDVALFIAYDIQRFWGISDKTMNLFLELKKQKEDSFCRNYITRIADKEHFNKTKEIIFREQD